MNKLSIETKLFIVLFELAQLVQFMLALIRVDSNVCSNILNQSGLVFQLYSILIARTLHSNGPLLCVGTIVMEMESLTVKNSEIQIVPGRAETYQREPRIYPVQVVSSSYHNSPSLLGDLIICNYTKINSIRKISTNKTYFLITNAQLSDRDNIQ